MAAPCARSVSVPRGSASGPSRTRWSGRPTSPYRAERNVGAASSESSAATIAALPIPSDVRSRRLQYFKLT